MRNLISQTLAICKNHYKVSLQYYNNKQQKIYKQSTQNHIFLLYCPPTSNMALVICPSEQCLQASINSAKMLRF